MKKLPVFAIVTLLEKCPYSEFFWSIFSPIPTEYGPEKLVIRTLFTQNFFLWIRLDDNLFLSLIIQMLVISRVCLKREERTAWKASKHGDFSGTYFLVFSPNTGKYGPGKLHKVMIKNANFFVLIVSCLRTHQRKNFTLKN